MFTQCPECRTVFKVTAEQLQVARGDVRCGDCACTFNAIESLTEAPPELHDPVADDDIDVADLDVIFERDDGFAMDDFPADESPEEDVADDTDTEDQPTSRLGETFEFDVPENNWADFFVDANPSPGRAPGPPATEATPGEAFASDAADDAAADDEDMPPWLRDQPAESTGHRPARPLWATGVLVLLIALSVQLAHYNRDEIATSPQLGALITSVYARLGADLYPDWALRAFRVRGSEVVGGVDDTLEISADVEVVGPDAVGLPLVRVALRDRWSNPIAGKVFRPDEYLRPQDGEALHPGDRVPPGTVIPVNIRVIDPGTDAEGYELDICLPRRHRGLQCQGQQSPFSQ